MDRLGLTLHPAKTRLVDLRRGKESFVFLGCTTRKKRSIQRAPDKHFMRDPFTGDQLHGMGLHQLMGSVEYPAQATPRRPSLSRVPENGTHGLKGEHRNGLA